MSRKHFLFPLERPPWLTAGCGEAKATPVQSETATTLQSKTPNQGADKAADLIPAHAPVIFSGGNGAMRPANCVTGFCAFRPGAQLEAKDQAG